MAMFLRSFTFGHVRQFEALASRFLAGLAGETRTIGQADGQFVLGEVDDTVIEGHDYAKQSVGCGYLGLRGWIALLGTVAISGTAPVTVAQRLRRGSCGSPRIAWPPTR